MQECAQHMHNFFRIFTLRVMDFLRYLGTPLSFFTKFSKGENCDFLLVAYRLKSSQNGVISYRNEFAPVGANSFLYEMTPIYMGGNYKNDKVASPESVPIYLKPWCPQKCDMTGRRMPIKLMPISHFAGPYAKYGNNQPHNVGFLYRFHRLSA